MNDLSRGDETIITKFTVLLVRILKLLNHQDKIFTEAVERAV